MTIILLKRGWWQWERFLFLMLTSTTVVLPLGVVFAFGFELPSGDQSAHYLWLGIACTLAAVCLILSSTAPLIRKHMFSCLTFYSAIIWSLILLGSAQAVWGLLQIYGSASSNHSLYSLTGSFFNPGPYSGYLAMIFPLCLNEWLSLKSKKGNSQWEKLGYWLSLVGMLLILIVLPAGMSRSAWLAAFLSGAWVYGMHHDWGIKLKTYWHSCRKRLLILSSGTLIVFFLLCFAIFNLKKDSASGRLFMWKIECLAIAEKPFTGYGQGSFSSAYGAAQEAYFSKGGYQLREELVAGSPEYSFNEYLQVAIEWGVPVLLCILILVGICFWRGVRQKRYSACGGIISLMIFSFSSYPMQLPAFIIAFVFLLMACLMGTARTWLLGFSVFIGAIGICFWHTNTYNECRDWAFCKRLYQQGAYRAAKEEYEKLYPVLKNRGAFMFEYGYCLHKLKEYEASNDRLKQAAVGCCDPMIFNVIGKNYQQQGDYQEAERWLIRSTHLLPGRIYPYYLLAKLYAEPSFYQSDKLRQMIDIVLAKEPKVQSKAVEEMREEVRMLL